MDDSLKFSSPNIADSSDAEHVCEIPRRCVRVLDRGGVTPLAVVVKVVELAGIVAVVLRLVAPVHRVDARVLREVLQLGQVEWDCGRAR